jgi:tetratricopeptide (TPR) repeat protein
MFNIGLVYRAAGRFDEAESWMERGLAVTEAAKGADHPDVVNSLFALAPLYERRGRLEQALSLYDRAVASRERTHGPDHLWTAGALRSRGNTEFALGRYEEACDDLRRADGIAASAPPESPGRLMITLDLARCEAHRGRTGQASEMLDGIATIPERDGVEDEVAAYAAYLRAWIARAEGRDADADAALERALGTRRSFEEAPSANALYVEAVLAAHRGEGGRAATRLTAAVDAGFPPWLVDFEVDFAPIRDRDDLPLSLRERREDT